MELTELPPYLRDSLIKRYSDRFSLRELGGAFGLSAETVRRIVAETEESDPLLDRYLLLDPTTQRDYENCLVALEQGLTRRGAELPERDLMALLFAVGEWARSV